MYIKTKRCNLFPENYHGYLNSILLRYLVCTYLYLKKILVIVIIFILSFCINIIIINVLLFSSCLEGFGGLAYVLFPDTPGGSNLG